MSHPTRAARILDLLFGLHQLVDRRTYLTAGVLLMALKLSVDMSVLLYATGRWWMPWEYLSFIQVSESVPLITTQILMLWALPFAFLVILTAMANFDQVYLEAAYMSGAGRLRAFFEVELPQIHPGILGAAVFSLIISFNETIRTAVVAARTTHSMASRETGRSENIRMLLRRRMTSWNARAAAAGGTPGS